MIEMLKLMKATLRDAQNGDERAKQILLMYLNNKTIQQTIAIFAAAGLGMAQPTQSMWEEDDKILFALMRNHIRSMENHGPDDVLRALSEKKYRIGETRGADEVKKFVIIAA